VDENPVCLMHSRDPEKSDAEFQKEFERILRHAGDGLADFSGFIFSGSDYRGREFVAQCGFDHATFTQGANFWGAAFKQNAAFQGATFTQEANFYFVTFKQSADFGGVTFTRGANFEHARFTQDARFSSARFAHDALFYGATFTSDIRFDHAEFTRRANFFGATFARGANFFAAEFAQDADFSYAAFAQRAEFSLSTFAGTVDFQVARFTGGAEFKQTQFTRDCQDKGHEPGPVFSSAVFEEPGNVVFSRTYLGRALFHNCDVSRMNFSVVTWCKRSNGKRMVFDEAVDPRHKAATALRLREDDLNPRNYRLIAELYQQLKKNYDDRRDYWTAGDFHYGEMEMKRLASDHRNKALRWLHSNLGLLAWYKYASEYGESYVRPAWLLGLVLLVFMLLYPVAGLRLNAGRSGTPATASANAEKLTYWHPSQNSGDTRPIWRARLALVGHSANTTVSISLFLREMAYEPADPWGTAAKLAEMVLTSTLGALFLLSVRRQFKR